MTARTTSRSRELTVGVVGTRADFGIDRSNFDDLGGLPTFTRKGIGRTHEATGHNRLIRR